MRIWHQGIDGVHAFYANGLMRSLALSMVTIFLPVFIYLQGMKVWQVMSSALLLVAGFYIMQRMLIAILVFPLSKLIEKIGFRRSITLSALLLLGFIVCLLLAENNLNWLWVALVCEGLNIPLYWISRDSALSQDIPGKEMGGKMRLIVVLENIAGLLGPFAGGAIVVFFGYSTLFTTVLGLLVVSIIPLWWMPPHTHKNGVSLAGFWGFLKNGRYRHQVIANFGCALTDYGNGIIWPLMLFLQGINHEQLGAIFSAAAIVTIAIQYVSGGWFDRLRAKRDLSDEWVYGIATVWTSIIWIARLFVQGIGQVMSLDMGRQLLGTIHNNFYIDYLHLGGKRMGSIAFWVYMEVVYSVGVVFIFGIMATGIYYGNWKEMVLITISLWSLVTVVMGRESNL